MQAQKFRDQRTDDTSHKVKVRLIEIIIFHLMHKNPVAPVTITRHVTWLIHIKLLNINCAIAFFLFLSESSEVLEHITFLLEIHQAMGVFEAASLYLQADYSLPGNA